MPTEAEPKPRPTRNRSPLLIVCAVIVLIPVVVGIGMLVGGAWISLKAEENLHATQFAIRLVEQFVYENGRWPTSWGELERVSFPTGGLSPLSDWYADSRVQHELREWRHRWPKLESQVEIDFSADMAGIVLQDPMTVEAIKPIGPYYEWRGSNHMASLQDTLRQALAGQLPINPMP